MNQPGDHGEGGIGNRDLVEKHVEQILVENGDFSISSDCLQLLFNDHSKIFRFSKKSG
jgi:tricorn protease-like protein